MIKALRMAEESDDEVVKDMIKNSTMKLDINIWCEELTGNWKWKEDGRERKERGLTSPPPQSPEPLSRLLSKHLNTIDFEELDIFKRQSQNVSFLEISIKRKKGDVIAYSCSDLNKTAVLWTNENIWEI